MLPTTHIEQFFSNILFYYDIVRVFISVFKKRGLFPTSKNGVQ